MPNLQIPAIARLKVAGKDLEQQISRIRLEQPIDGHHELTVHLRLAAAAEEAPDVISARDFSAMLGESISATITPTGGLVDTARELQFTGVVTQVRMENAIDGVNTVVVTGRSPTIAMDGAPRNGLYHDESASDLVEATVRRYPITVGRVESSEGRATYVVQYRESDYHFVMRLAAAGGFFAYYTGQAFRLTRANSDEQEELVWRESLGAFALNLGTAPPDYEGVAYNYQQARVFRSDTRSSPPGASMPELLRVTPEASQKVYEAAGFVPGGAHVEDMQSLDRLLTRERNRAIGRMTRCVGESVIPSVGLGKCVKIKGMGDLDGVYWVEQVTHLFDESGQYANEFVCVPLEMAFPQPRYTRAPLTHLQSATVVENADPENLGRIKVSFPWSDSESTPWVRFVSIYAGQERGWYSIPEVGDEVLVGFEEGDPARPIAIGAVYNGQSTPDSAVGSDNNDIKAFTTRSGHRVIFSDTDGDEKIQITTAGGHQILMSDAGGAETVAVSTADDKCRVVLDAATPALTIESRGDITIKGNNITLEGSGAIELKAMTDINIKATGNVNSEASVNQTIKGGAQVTVQGAIINLN